MSKADSRIDPNSPIPLYSQVEKLVRELISAAKYQEGALLPDEITLAEQWGVSRNTVRTAMGALVAEGVLERRSGVGTSVRKDRLSSGVAAWRSFNAEMKRRGITVEQLSCHCKEVPANADVAKALQIPEGTPVLFLERIRGWDKIPSISFQSFLHPRLKMTVNENYERPLSDLFAERAGVVPARSVDEFMAVAAQPELAAALKVEPSTPLLLRKRIVYDARNKPIEYAWVTYRSDRFTLTLTLE
jgi:GntR family transcriptional regulator